MDLTGKAARRILPHSGVRLRGNDPAQEYGGIEPPLRA